MMATGKKKGAKSTKGTGARAGRKARSAPVRVQARVRPVGVVESPGGEALVEVRIERPGFSPVRAVLPRTHVTPTVLRDLKASARALPRLAVSPSRGAVDIRLDDSEGNFVKSGSVTLSRGAQGRIAIPIDPVTRRFRAANLVPGTYSLRAASVQAGTADARLTVRRGDVTRSAIRLKPLRGRHAKVDVVIPVQKTPNASIDRLTLTARDVTSGRVAFEGEVPIVGSEIRLKLDLGRFHLDLQGVGYTNCYDVEVHDPRASVIVTDVLDLGPRIPQLQPGGPGDPPPWLAPLRGFGDLGEVLTKLKIGSLDELAGAEAEGLMHRATRLLDREQAKLASKDFARAIAAARQHLGLTPIQGDVSHPLKLAKGQGFARSVLPAAAGTVTVHVALPAATDAELVVDSAGGLERRIISSGNETIEVAVSTADVAARTPIRLTLTNRGDASATGTIVIRTPRAADLGAFFPPRTTKDYIEGIYRQLAERNVGISTSVLDSAIAPDNIMGWIRHAQSIMARARVCSIDDLGRFRVNPMAALEPGLYIAPLKANPPIPLTLMDYGFVETLAGSVLRYRPNQILHDTAVVMAGSWDIRGQSILIGSDVRELVVIARSILHDSASQIGWEGIAPAPASQYWPNPAPPGNDGPGPGDAGQPGTPGDPNPHPSRNGGGDALQAGPTVTMYVLDSTNGLPPIHLQGRDGAPGGRGQDGGHGGNGHEGLRADGHWYSGCCRGAGFGGAGGVGGAGGGGGKGGNGGAGGRITLLTSPDSIVALDAAPPDIDVTGGAGGAGGDAGSPGPGGFGGPAGSADCEAWCDDHPERRGADGPAGVAGAPGSSGDPGPDPVSDALQVLPITEEQWNQELNNPHILGLSPLEGEPGTLVTIQGEHLIPGTDRIFFDGTDVGPVASGTSGQFIVPATTDGGYHPVVVRPPGVSPRKSNRVMFHVLPELDVIAQGTRWVENQNVTLTGSAFSSGAVVLAEDWSQAGHPAIALPVVGVLRTSIDVQIPGAPLMNLRGVKRIRVRNPDGGTTRDERVARISDTIVVRVAAFKVAGTTPGVGSKRTDAEITALFTEGTPHTISGPWGVARISYQLVQPVQTISLADDVANLLPTLGTTALDRARDTGIFNGAPGVNGAVNVFFFRDVELATAYSWQGQGLIMYGEEGDDLLGDIDFEQVVAHEVGHALALSHVCPNSGEMASNTLFNRACRADDDAFLMYPYYNSSDSMDLSQAEVDISRDQATQFELGKVQLRAPFAHPTGADTQN